MALDARSSLRAALQCHDRQNDGGSREDHAGRRERDRGGLEPALGGVESLGRLT
jgi:hypothetical protein